MSPLRKERLALLKAVESDVEAIVALQDQVRALWAKERAIQSKMARRKARLGQIEMKIIKDGGSL